jgi:prepilin-type N-terminal cleavage/methylation domain-containing protein
MRRRTKGVTLIELLIAVSLLSILSVGILMALRVGLNAMDKATSKLMANRRSVRTQQILRSQIEGFIPVWADCAPGTGMPPTRMPFFEGQPQSMRFVSSYSLEEAARGMPRVLEFQVIPGAEGRGVRLIVNQYPYTGRVGLANACAGVVSDPETHVLMPLFRPVEIGPRSFVLADKLAYCRFSFREPPRPPAPERWYPVWPRQEWPSAIHIDMAPLDPDPSRVPLMSATVPFRVNRLPGFSYGQ